MNPPSLGPTGHAGVDAILAHLLAAIRPALGEDLVAMYVGGSLAAGAFSPNTSDVDLVVVTECGVTDDQAAALRAAHDRLTALPSKWAKKLEILYVPRDTLSTRNATTERCAYLGVGGWFGAVPYQSDWIVQLDLVREHGIVVHGPNPKLLVTPITSDELRTSTAAIMRENWEPLLSDTSRFDAEYQAYTVLTMCRLLYTLEHGAIATKPEAASWAKHQLPENWAPLIDYALSWRAGAPLDRLNEVLALVRYTADRAQCYR